MLAKFIFKQLGVNFEDRMDYYDFPIDEREDGKSYNSWNVKRFDKSKYSGKPTVFYSLEFLKFLERASDGIGLPFHQSLVPLLSKH